MGKIAKGTLKPTTPAYIKKLATHRAKPIQIAPNGAVCPPKK